MAVTTSLKSVVEQISGVIRSVAGEEGWDQDDFALAGSFDPRTGQFTLVLGSDRAFSESAIYSRIRRGLRSEFGVVSSVPSMVVLVVQKIRKLASVYENFVVGEDEIDLTDML